MFEKPEQFPSFAAKLWGANTVMALDAGGATYRALGDGQPHAVVVLDPDGKVVHRSMEPSKGAYFYNSPGKPPVAYADLKRAVESCKAKGLLSDIQIPPKMAPIAAAIKQGHLAKAQEYLEKVPSSGTYGAARAEIETRLGALRQRKRALFDSLLEAGTHWDAYKAGASYVRCFPSAPDGDEVKAKLTALKGQPDVKKNLDARTSFRRYALGCYGPLRKVKDPAQAAGFFRKLASKHEGTEYGEAAGRVAN